jgi:uroporphyrinogen decarboxylase
VPGKALLDVLQNRKPDRRPVWFMRQAGRYLPEYREIRSRAGSFLDLCYNPELASEVTLQPLRRFDLDAAIIFADILVVPHAMGVGLRFAEGEGPVLDKVEGSSRVRALRPVKGSKEAQAVCRTVSLVRETLPDKAALIGFCGAPWTVASYMIEGGSSEERMQARLAAYQRPQWFVDLMDRLIEASCDYLEGQVDAGAEVLQIFDSWAGDLTGSVFDETVVEPISLIRAELRRRCGRVPVIVFARGAGSKHARVAAAAGAEAVGVEQAIELDWVLRDLPEGCAIQGNLDPAALLADGGRPEALTQGVLRQAPMERHIFNLGHGVKPSTELRALARVIETIRQWDESSHGQSLSVA